MQDQIKQELIRLGAKIGKIEIERGMGIYRSEIERRKLINQFRILRNQYLKLKKPDLSIKSFN